MAQPYPVSDFCRYTQDASQCHHLQLIKIPINFRFEQCFQLMDSIFDLIFRFLLDRYSSSFCFWGDRRGKMKTQVGRIGREKALLDSICSFEGKDIDTVYYII